MNAKVEVERAWFDKRTGFEMQVGETLEEEHVLEVRQPWPDCDLVGQG